MSGTENRGLFRATDITAEVFLILRSTFFDGNMQPRNYPLRDKRNAQDDPFDEYVHKLLSEQLQSGTICVKAPGPLITPDFVVVCPAMCNGVSRTMLASDLSRIIGVEVKKLERIRGGEVARSSGMDYNTTPPCGMVRVYDESKHILDIRSFYLFVCQSAVPDQTGQYRLSALALCDGNLLNSDFAYYLSVVGARSKKLGLGTYRDGADRSRPMLIFPNPLGVPELDHEITLVHPRVDLENEFPQLLRVGLIKRTVPLEETREFHCYRLRNDVQTASTHFELTDPFPSPNRTEKTQPRGRFRVPVKPTD